MSLLKNSCSKFKVILRYKSEVKVVTEQKCDVKCDPRPPPKKKPKETLQEFIAKWIRKYITGSKPPPPPPPFDPRPYCAPGCDEPPATPLPPFPTLSCCYDGIMEHTKNHPPLLNEKVFLLRQRVISWTQNEDREIAMLKYIESEEFVRDFQDPIPKNASPAETLLELVDKKLHPSYHMHLRISPLECHIADKYFVKRQTKIPIRIRYNMKQLEKKKFFVDMKRHDIPPDSYCDKELALKTAEKNMLDAKKRAEIVEQLQRARILIKNYEENRPIFRGIDDSLMRQKCQSC